ncbi:response regulator [Chitinibacteraceae bacterium HSL-7]
MKAQGCRVYIVDDSAPQRLHAAHVCEALGMQVVGMAADGIEASLVLGRNELAPQLLLLDLEMPGIDGLGLLQELARSGIALSVVVLSSREQTLLSSIEQLQHTGALQVLGALQKPLRGDALEQLLDRKAVSEREAAVQDAILGADEAQAALDSGSLQALYRVRVGLQGMLLHSAEVMWHVPGETPCRLGESALAGMSFSAAWRAQILPVFEQAQRWQDKGLRIHLALPVAARWLESALFGAQISEWLTGHALSATSLQLILTQPEWPATPRMLATASQLRLKGVGLTIPASEPPLAWIGMLGSLPLDEVRIHARYLERARNGPVESLILQHLLPLTRALKVAVTVDGVRSLTILQQARALGFDFAQGTALGGALEADAIAAWSRTTGAALHAQLQGDAP